MSNGDKFGAVRTAADPFDNERHIIVILDLDVGLFEILDAATAVSE